MFFANGAEWLSGSHGMFVGGMLDEVMIQVLRYSDKSCHVKIRDYMQILILGK